MSDDFEAEVERLRESIEAPGGWASEVERLREDYAKKIGKPAMELWRENADLRATLKHAERTDELLQEANDEVERLRSQLDETTANGLRLAEENEKLAKELFAAQHPGLWHDA